MSVQTAATIYGAPVDPGVASTGPTPQCVFSAKGRSGDVNIGVMTSAMSGGANLATMFPTIAASDRSHTAESVPGLGDKCAIVYDKVGASIFVLTHGTILAIGVDNYINPSFKTALIDAARHALASM
jgi:hypothetical protein